MRRVRLSLIGVLILALAMPVWAMILLDATTASLEVVLGGAVTTNQLPFTASYADHTSSAFTPDQNNGTTNSTTAVTLVAAPAASTQRQVKFLSVYNADTVSATVTIRYNDNGTTRNIVVVALPVGSTLEYSDAQGFRVISSNGQIQQGGGASDSEQYWVGAASSALTAEKNLGALSTGLVVNTSGTPSAYAGASCTNQFPRSLDGSGAATCASVAIGSDVSGLGTGVATFLGTPSSANFASAVTGETGTGGVVFDQSPTIVTPTIASFANAAHDHEDAAGGATLDHGLALTGLTDDDHTQYGLLAGRSGGQTFTAGTGSGDDFIFRTTTNATKGTFFFEQGDALELASGTTAMQLRLREPSAGGTAYVSFATPALAANVAYTLPPDDGDASEVLRTDGAGVLTWEAGGTGVTATGTPVDNQVAVWTSASAIEGTSGLTFDGTTLTTPGQIAFPATQAASAGANVLDDYEEGTWTPVIGGSGGTSGQVYSQQTGTYVKIGQLVVLSISVELSTEGTITDDVQIQGLPFTSMTVANTVAVGVLRWNATATTWVRVDATVGSAVTVAGVTGAAAAATSSGSALTATDIGATTQFKGTLIYRASS